MFTVSSVSEICPVIGINLYHVACIILFFIEKDDSYTNSRSKMIPFGVLCFAYKFFMKVFKVLVTVVFLEFL